MRIAIFIILLYLTFAKIVLPQACCTAGTPLLSSLEMSASSKGILSLGLSTKYNSLTNVYNGSLFLEDQERERISQSYILEITYGFSKRVSFSALLSFMHQTRKIQTIINLNNVLNVKGFGDALFLVKYNLITTDLFNRTELTIGTGIKLPFGKSSISQNSIFLPADMQPGTGSIDGLLWLYFSQGNIFTPQITVLANSSYRINGSNKRFGINQSGYKFGNEFIFTTGLTYSTDTFLDVTLLTRFRNTSADKFGSDEIPNTGGNWMFLLPGFNVKITNEFTARISGEFPIYTNVSGTQLTTTFSTSISLYYSIKIINGLEL